MDPSLGCLETPLGTLLVASDGAAVCLAEFADCRGRLERLLARRFPGARLRRRPVGAATAEALRRYFEGDPEAIERLPVAPRGTTFQEAVWRALRRIPAGRTMTYGALARQIGRPEAIRALGAANGANPVAIVIPCHRLVGADGRLTGYGSGLHRKAWLLRHEGVTLAGEGTAAVIADPDRLAPPGPAP